MPAYADTSFLVRAYTPHADSQKVLAWLQRAREPLPFTPLHCLELLQSTTRSSRSKQYEASTGETPPAAGLGEWVEKLDDLEASLRIVCMKDEVLRFTEAELAEKVAGLFNTLLPLVLLATEQNPMPAILEYL